MRTLVAVISASIVIVTVGVVRDADAARPKTGYVPVPVNNPQAAEMPHVIFMNRHGGIFHGTYGSTYDEDASNNNSSIFSGTVTFPEYPYGDASWNSVMSCMREIYAPFNIEITDVDPGNTPHIESVTTGSPGMIGMDDYTGGVAPFDCGVINYAVVYAFPSVWGNDPRAICETAAQETAHAFGLDHEYLCEDPMTYLWGCGNKHFQNVDADCGEDGPRTCSCGGSKQNSVRMLTMYLGPRDATPPSVNITFPQDGSSVQAGFRVDVVVDDSIGAKKVDLYLDGGFFQTDESFPFGFTTPPTLGEGDHELTVVAVNYADLEDEQTIHVDIQPPCASSDECAEGNICVGDECVPGPDNPGGLGSECAAPVDCYSGHCDTNDGDVWRCSQTCEADVAQDDPLACPGGFACVPFEGGSGFCWPTEGKGCCAVVGASSSRQEIPWSSFAALAILALALIRRRA